MNRAAATQSSPHPPGGPALRPANPARVRPAVRVIGCGNADAGDDAIGLLAVRALRRRVTGDPTIQIVEAPSGLRVIDLLEGADAVIIVDAVHATRHGRAGTLVRVEAGPDGLPAILSAAVSTHGLGVADAVALAAALDRLPRTVFVGVHVSDVSAGALLSPEVAWAMPALVGRLREEIRHLRAEERATP